MKFSLKKVNDVAVKEQCEVKSWNRFTVLENCIDNDHIDRAWEIIRNNIKISAEKSIWSELEYQKPWVDEQCSDLLDQS